MPQIAITTNEPNLSHKAQALAAELHLPFQAVASTDFALQLSSQHLALIKTNNPKLKPLFIDFEQGPMAYRKQRASLRQEPLARAIGLHPNQHPTLVDATAGFGQDAYLLACLGYTVTLLERSPILFALLRDGIQRLTEPTIRDRLTLILTDARDWLPTQPKPDVITLDPMFPERKKSAAVKKGMALLHELLDTTQEDDLLAIAQACAAYRVVVKRPRLAKNMAGQVPTYSLTGPKVRYDIYQVVS